VIPTKKEVRDIIETELSSELADRLTVDEIADLASAIINRMSSDLDVFEDEDDDEEDDFTMLDD
jgi:hypothetical protein